MDNINTRITINVVLSYIIFKLLVIFNKNNRKLTIFVKTLFYLKIEDRLQSDPFRFEI